MMCHSVGAKYVTWCSISTPLFVSLFCTIQFLNTIQTQNHRLFSIPNNMVSESVSDH
ncbi:hypothetical protein Hanom_Chr01g00052511 [Helianthus anomalus]